MLGPVDVHEGHVPPVVTAGREQGGHRRWLGGQTGHRRWLGWGATSLAAVAALGAVRPTIVPAWWWPTTVLTAALAGFVLASYLPPAGAGRRLQVGCSPCAAAAGVTVLLAAAARFSAPADAGSAALALLLIGVGAAQRLGDATSCRT